MRSILFILPFLMAIISCRGIGKSDNMLSGNIDTIVYKKNAYLFYKGISDSTYLALWGKDTENLMSDTLPILPMGKPLLYWYNNDFISLRQGCGTSCFFAYILPMKSNKIRIIMYPMAYDVTTNRIAYSENNNPNVFLVIEDLLTGDKNEILTSFIPGPFPGHSIDSIKFTSNGLYVKWLDINSRPIEIFF